MGKNRRAMMELTHDDIGELQSLAANLWLDGFMDCNESGIIAGMLVQQWLDYEAGCEARRKWEQERIERIARINSGTSNP